MGKFFRIALIFVFFATIAGCGNDGSSSLNSALLEGTDQTATPQERQPGILGALVDLKDLVYPEGDQWYFTRGVAVNDNGIVVGQSNRGTPARAAFLLDSNAEDPEMRRPIYLGIHSNHGGLVIGAPPIGANCPSAGESIHSEAVDINNADQIIGNSTTGIGWPNEDSVQKRAFLYQNGQFIDLNSMISDFLGNPVASDAVDINEKGEIIFTVHTPACKQIAMHRAADGTLSELGKVLDADMSAVKINENGKVAINAEGEELRTVIFHDLERRVIETLNHLPLPEVDPAKITTFAVNINDSVKTPLVPMGHIIGNSTNGDPKNIDLKTDVVQGFFWDGGAMYPVNHLGGGNSMVTDFNDQDQVVGSAKLADGSSHAISWILGEDKKGHIFDLGTLGGANSQAVAINEAGQIVGWSETGEFYREQGIMAPVRHAFLWQNGVMYDLGTHDDFYAYPFTPPFPFSEATAINASGQTIGNSLTINAHSRGFLLSPIFP